MKEITIKFNYDKNKGNISNFINNPFDVFVDGEKIPRLKRIEIDFQKYDTDNINDVPNIDDFKYKIEQYVNVFDLGE